MSQRSFLTGIADEAASKIEDQLKIHSMLGWRHLELRTVDGIALAELPDTSLNSVCDTILNADFEVVVIDSQIGSWKSKITDPFELDMNELERLIEVSKRLSCSMIRVMSYPNYNLSEYAWRIEVINRLRKLTKLSERHGIMLIHENCAGWGGLNVENSLQLIKQTGADNFRLLFDVGNGLSYGYSSYEFLEKIIPWIAHVHLKDGHDKGTNITYSDLGEGEADVEQCIRMLSQGGYRNAYSIEPHLNFIPHLQLLNGTPEMRGHSYMQYAQKTKLLMEKVIPGILGVTNVI